MATVQSRDVSDQTLRRLKARAAERGLSLSAYVARELDVISQRPTLDEMAARLQTRAPTRLSASSTRALLEDRNAR